MYKVINHPLILHKLTMIRNKNTSMKEVRELMFEISLLLCTEVLKNLTLKNKRIETPLAKTIGYVISENVNLFPILRAGLGLLDGFMKLLPNVRVGHIGIYRDENSLKPIKYLFKNPIAKNNQKTINIILDPMIATGGSSIEAINSLKNEKHKNIKLVCLLSTKEILEKIEKEHPDVEIIVCSIEKKLDSKGFLIPGLGDAGDRLFGTK